MQGKYPRIALLILTAIAGYMLWQNQSRNFRDEGRLVITQNGDSVVLYWASEIDVPMERRFAEAYAKWKDQTEIFVVDLNSPGGSVREGNRVIKILERMKETHLLATRVGSNNICLSMCVPVYLQGEKRLAAANSRWMFHEPRAVNYFTGEDESGPDFERELISNRFFDRYFSTADLNKQWQEKLRKDWIGKDLWKTGAELVTENSNVIHTLYRN